MIRWKHPQRGMIQPDDFIRIAEETGMIREIGLWVLTEACKQMCQWRKQFPDQPWLDVAVNVSPVQLRDRELVQQVAQILAETGLEASGLQIEITESALLDHLDQAREVLRALKGLGVGLKLDDFGTGYSCLRYLYQLPFDAIKIDRSFVSAGSRRRQNRAGRNGPHHIIDGIEFESGGYRMEGIENQASYDLLRSLGCRFGQGFYFSRAVNAKSAAAILREGRILRLPNRANRRLRRPNEVFYEAFRH